MYIIHAHTRLVTAVLHSRIERPKHYGTRLTFSFNRRRACNTVPSNDDLLESGNEIVYRAW